MFHPAVPLKRFYRPALQDSSAQLKIAAIREQLALMGVATGRSKARRGGIAKGTTSVSISAALEQLQRFDLENRDSAAGNETAPDGTGFWSHSVMMNVQVRLKKEQSNGVRGILNLPHPDILNAPSTILVFAGDVAKQAARDAGADVVGGEELVGSLLEGKLDLSRFNRCLATTALLPTLLKISRILGPRGLMPSVKTGTLVDAGQIAAAVRSARQSQPFRIERTAGLLSMSVGAVRGETRKLQENVEAVLDHVKRLGSTDGTSAESSRYLLKAYLSTRNHPGIKII